MRTVIRLWFLLSAFAVGAQDSALVDTNGVLVHPTNFISANGIAPLASPALSGNPTAPTATVGDNDTSISTTAFVAAAIEALKALQLWQDTNAVLTRLAGIGAGVSGDIIYRDATGWTNRASGTAAFSAATDFQATNANLTTIAGLTGGNASNFFRGTGAFMQVTTNDVTGLPALIAAQLKDAPLNTTTYARSNGVWTTNLPASQLAGLVSTSNLSGLLSGLSVGNGGGVTNLQFPIIYAWTNTSTNATTNTFTIPANAKTVTAILQSAGSSGGSGALAPAGAAAGGGSGGSGGSRTELKFSSESLLSVTNVWSVFIDGIRLGAAAQTTNGANGLNGTGNASTRLYA